MKQIAFTFIALAVSTNVRSPMLLSVLHAQHASTTDSLSAFEGRGPDGRRGNNVSRPGL
jgi:hypothetical protein